MLSNALRNPAAPAANRFSPEYYDGMYGQFASYNEGLARVCAAAADIEQIDHLVELGSGTGLFSRPLIAAFRPRRFTGIDANVAMLAQAQQRVDASNVVFHCDRAQNLPRYCGARTIDVIVIKAAFHLFEDEISLDALLDQLTDRGRLIIVEHTPRSAATFPILDDARAQWDACLARRAEAPLHQHRSFLAHASYGRHVRMASKGYFEAIEHGQLSFTWPLDPAHVRRWAHGAKSVSGEFVQVYEEFVVSVFGRSAPG
jgi:trans-aconitate methyltransferase